MALVLIPKVGFASNFASMGGQEFLVKPFKL